jgi:hypothetical protein
MKCFHWPEKRLGISLFYDQAARERLEIKYDVGSKMSPLLRQGPTAEDRMSQVC